MRVSDFEIADTDSTPDLTTPLEIEAFMNKRDDAGMNSFWLSHGTEKFPAINIMVNGDLAYCIIFRTTIIQDTPRSVRCQICPAGG